MVGMLNNSKEERDVALNALKKAKEIDRRWVMIPVRFTRNGRPGIRFVKEYRKHP